MNAKPEGIDQTAHHVQKEGTGFWKATIVTLIIAAVVAMIVSTLVGCAALGGIDQESMDILDQYVDIWIEKIEDAVARRQAEKPAAPPAPDVGETTAPTTPPSVEVPAGVDAVPFSALKWKYGGFDGSRATLDQPRLSNLRSTGSRIYYHWDVGLHVWGLALDEAGAVCAVFVYRDGVWIGGKFDWVSTSREDRELKHMLSYSNWPSSGISLPWKGPLAYVVVSADGKMRSNVVAVGLEGLQ